MDWRSASLASLVPGIVGVALVTAYLILLLSVESQTGIAILLLGGAAALLGAAKLGILDRFRHSFTAREPPCAP